MSLQIAYLKENDEDIDLNELHENTRVNIADYDKTKHKGKIFCPLGHKLIGKQGNKMTWHYAHTRGYEDDCCNREMGSWHHWWQGRVYDDFLEVIYKKKLIDNERSYIKTHIADMVNSEDIIIEFQKSTIPEKVITQREKFYENMIWVFGCEGHDMEILKTSSRFMVIKITGGSLYFTIAKKQSFLDFGKRHILEVLEVDKKLKSKILIYVKIWTLVEFDKKFMMDCLKENYDDRKYHPGYNFEDDGSDFEKNEKILKKNFKKTKKFLKKNFKNSKKSKKMICFIEST